MQLRRITFVQPFQPPNRLSGQGRVLRSLRRRVPFTSLPFRLRLPASALTVITCLKLPDLFDVRFRPPPKNVAVHSDRLRGADFLSGDPAMERDVMHADAVRRFPSRERLHYD